MTPPNPRRGSLKLVVSLNSTQFPYEESVPERFEKVGFLYYRRQSEAINTHCFNREKL